MCSVWILFVPLLGWFCVVSLLWLFSVGCFVCLLLVICCFVCGTFRLFACLVFGGWLFTWYFDCLGWYACCCVLLGDLLVLFGCLCLLVFSCAACCLFLTVWFSCVCLLGFAVLWLGAWFVTDVCLLLIRLGVVAWFVVCCLIVF